MEGTWALGGHERTSKAEPRFIVSQPSLRTTLLPRSDRTAEAAERASLAVYSSKCIATRCDFPVE